MKGVRIDVGSEWLDMGQRNTTASLSFANDDQGIAQLLVCIAMQGAVHEVVRASGGDERGGLAACLPHGVWISRVNGARARDSRKAWAC